MVRYHGNWCGDNWTAGQHKPSSELTDADRNVPAVDGLDLCCKHHDIGLHDATTDEEVKEVNDRFIREARNYGIKGELASILVGLAGPSHPNPTPSATMSPGRTSKSKKRFDPTRVEREAGSNNASGKRLRGYSDDPEALEREMRQYDSTRVPGLPDYEEIEDQERREREEDNSIRDVLLGMRNDGSPEMRPVDYGRNLPIDPANVPLPNTPRDRPIDNRSWNERARNQNDDQGTSGRMDAPMTDAPEMATQAFGPANQRMSGGGRDDRMTTPVLRMRSSYPYHNTEQVILQHHGSVSFNYLKASGEADNALKIRMNTYVAPYTESSGVCTTVNQLQFTQVATGLSRQVVGRYVNVAGLNGNAIDINYHRNLSIFDDPLFSDPATTPFTLQKPAGADYYNNHFKAYTVTKTEWMIRVSFPYHALGGIDGTNALPDAAQIQTAIQNSHMAGQWHMPNNDAAARVFTHYTTEGGNVNPVNPPLDKTVIAMERWQNVYKDKVTVRPNQTVVLRGTWEPGMVHHNPLSDSDVDVWTATGVVPPTGHLEHLIIQLKREANTADNSSNPFRIACNVNIDLKYHVQFKEPLSEIQFPVGGQTNPANTAVNTRVLQTQPDRNV